MSKVNIKIKEIMQMIPHRYPFLLIDKIIELEEGVSAIGIKNVTMNEPHFTGHFPNDPIMPGVLIIEALAQASAVLVVKTLKAKPNSKGVLFASINNVKFRKPVIPGDTMELHVKILKNKMSLWTISGEAIVNGQKVTEAEFSAMIFDK
jgi:3-hydroxyacyl-[acyl-carrier-protein] dehydratase